MIRRIICTGNSHTWGQGASGILDGFDPPIIAGERRCTDLNSASYVNLLRRHVNTMTDSSSSQFGAKTPGFFSVKGSVSWTENIVIQNGSLGFSADKGLVRIQYCCSPDGGVAELHRNGKRILEIDSQSVVKRNDYRFCFLDLEEDCNSLWISCTGRQRFEIFRIEVYQGSYAVLNAGVGSSTTARYLKEFWASQVEEYRPDHVIIEAHSINDWLGNVGLDEYADNLTAMVTRVNGMGASPMVLTVSPILGNQLSGIGIAYAQYIEASRLNQANTDFILADAYRSIRQGMEEVDEQGKPLTWFEDDWHVNDRGHELYSRSIIQHLDWDAGRRLVRMK